ncbi:MAG TPA: ATP-binding protein [Vicinamibacterales bacterium]|nr:ATP-binding protein [Vicinamibacterales bacterium]
MTRTGASRTQLAFESLLKLSAAIGGATTLQETCDAALDPICQAFAVDRASVLLFDSGGMTRSTAWRGLSDDCRAVVERHTPWPPDEVAPEPVLAPDVCREPALARHAAVFAREGIAALAFFPLLGEGRVLGAFVVYTGEPRDFGAEEVSLGLVMGRQIGMAVERIHRERASRAMHERLLFALDAGQMGIWVWDLRTNEVRWSDNLERVHGLQPGSFNGTFAGYLQEIHPDDRARVQASIARALADDVPHDVEYRIVSPDGTVRWVHGKGRVERDADGRPVTMSGVCMDISMRKRAETEMEAALREEAAVRERLTLLTTGSEALLTSLDAASVAGEVLALARRVVSADAYAVWRRDGLTWRIAESSGLSEAFRRAPLDEQARAKIEQPVVAVDVTSVAILEPRRQAYEIEGIRSLMSVPLVVRGESIGSLVFYYRTPHAPDDMERHVALALGHLAAAAITTAELYEDQRRLRAEAQEANRLKDEFLATLSHELRTPLNVILGRAAMLRTAAEDAAAVRTAASTIERNASALARLVEDLLDVSRIARGQLRLERTRVQLADVIDAVIQGIHPAADSKGIVLEVAADRTMPPVVGDAARLQQVVWNLLVNAVKFTPPGGRVGVALDVEPRDVVLTVTDTGQGIAPEFLPHAFDMFRQAAPAAGRTFGGLGVGLSIVRRLVELHGGTVTAHSAGPGQGATFCVRLPRAEGGPAAIHPP